MARLIYSLQYLNQINNPSPVQGGNYIQLAVENASINGIPQSRIYLQGDAPPPFANMTTSSSITHRLYDYLDPGIYIVEYKDGAGQQELAKINMALPEDSCVLGEYEIQESFWMRIQPEGIYVNFYYGSISSPAGVDRGSKASFDGTIYKIVQYSPFTFWSNAELATLGTIIPDIKIKRNTGGCIHSPVTDIFQGDIGFIPMTVTYSKTNVTSDGGNDGSITLTITGGSGNTIYLWVDGPTSKNRTGLVEGVYHVTVTDVVTNEIVELDITITEPTPPSGSGSFLNIPTMNSIHFVVQSDISQCDNPQGLDNVLLCQQEYEGFDQTNYFQPFNICDVVSTQFNSDYSAFSIELRKYDNDAVVKTFTSELKEQNIGVSEDFGITIRSHTSAGQSRIYFNVGALPIPLNVGDVFTILNNADGYNGNYSIVDILNDVTVGYQYLVITKTFTGPGLSQLGTGRFLSQSADFNVYESVHEFLDLSEGDYYIRLVAIDLVDLNNYRIAISEPLRILNKHPETNQIKYRNIDNAFDITWTTGYQGMIRVPSHFGHRRSPGGERSTNRNSDFSLVKVSAKKTRVLLFQVWSLPPYMHEKLGTLFDCDNYTINGIECQTSEGYAEPEYKDRFLLADSSIKLEAKWYDRYNSDDLGSVGDGGFIMTETGFLKR
jgi:hypothetical protein